MAFQIQKIGNALVVTDTTTSNDVIDVPVNDVYFKIENSNFKLVPRTNLVASVDPYLTVPVAECQDSAAVAFTETTLKAWCRENLAAAGGGGGIGAMQVG